MILLSNLVWDKCICETIGRTHTLQGFVAKLVYPRSPSSGRVHEVLLVILMDRSSITASYPGKGFFD